MDLRQLTGQNFYTFNQKMGNDAWALGMVLLMMLLGSYPFHNLTIYETIPAINVLAESVKAQFDTTIDNVSGAQGDFMEYVHTRGQFEFDIAPGPLPTSIPGNLFLMIAGLLHPDPNLRLSVSECMGNPFLEIEKEGVFNIVSLERGM